MSPPPRVIKAGPAERVLPAPVADAKARAAEILAGAEAALAQARRDGFEHGRQEGLAEVTATLAAARAEATARAEAAQAELLRLGVRIAEKLLGRELALDPGAIADVVRAALAEAATRRELVVRVHPDDVAAVNAACERLQAALASGARLAVRADPAVARGGCLVDTEVGTIDARLATQLAAIERALTGQGQGGGGR